MFRKIGRSLVALGTVVSLAPLVAFTQSTPLRCTACKAMPEGGSTAAYLVAAGAICGIALLLRKRLRKARVS